MQWKPHVTVAAIACKDDCFLVVEEEDQGRLVINQPAGHLEAGETLLEAVRREVLEETAYLFEPRSITGLYLYPDVQADITYMRICFAGECVDHFPDRTLDEDIVRTRWMHRSDLQKHGDRMRSPLVMKCIDDYLAGKNHPLELLHHHPSGC